MIACSAVSSGAPTSWLAIADPLLDADLAVEEREAAAAEDPASARCRGTRAHSRARSGLVDRTPT